jgi:hypothetical protein
MREKFNTFYLETPKLDERLEGTNVDGRLVLKWILTKCSGWEAYREFFWLKVGTRVGSCEHGHDY